MSGRPLSQQSSSAEIERVAELIKRDLKLIEYGNEMRTLAGIAVGVPLGAWIAVGLGWPWMSASAGFWLAFAVARYYVKCRRHYRGAERP